VPQGIGPSSEFIMGNRAVITVEPYSEQNLGLYLHWNGGRASIEGLLSACKELGYRTPDSDCYGWARLASAAAAFFPDGLCVGMDTCNRLDTDNGDNGTYLIRGWEIVGRKFTGPGQAEEVNPAKTEEIRALIVERLRAAAKIGAEDAA
jgi:hypothetical protein